MVPFTIEHLEERTLADACPILHSKGAEPLASWWKNESRDLIRRGGGVLAARAADGSVHGVATYECVHGLRGGCILAVDTLMTFELSRKQPVKSALCDALYAMAAAFCCSAVAFPVPPKGYVRHLEKQIYGEGPQADS